MSFLSRWFSRLFGNDPDAPERLPSPDELVVLARPEGEPEALMMQDMLKSEGIVAMVRNRDASAARGATWGAPWSYELLVKQADLRRAREIVQVPDDK
jgi:hypothetical protein